MPTNQRTANVAEQAITARQVTAAICLYLEAYETGAPSSMGVLLEIARLGALVQRSPKPEGALDRLEPWPLRSLTDLELRALRAFYAPQRVPLETIGHDQQTGLRVVRKRRPYDWEVGRELGVSADEARRLLARARGKVRAEMERLREERDR